MRARVLGVDVDATRSFARRLPSTLSRPRGRGRARSMRATPVNDAMSSLDKIIPIPRVGLGTWRARPNDVRNAVRDALLAGYSHVDCAAAYANEREVGEALAEAFAAGVVSRDALWVTSKLWNDRRRPRDVREALMTTLDDLGLDYLDLYLIHWPVCWRRGTVLQPDAKASVAECWRELERCVDDGLVKHIGVSNFNEAQLAALIDDPRTRIKPSVNQIESHPMWANDDLVRFSQSRGVTVTAYSPLAQGGALFSDPIVVRLAEKHGVSPAQVVLRWNVQRDVVVIPKSTSPARIASNADIFGFELSAEDVDAMKSLDVKKSCASAPWSEFEPVASRNRVLRPLGRALSWLPFQFIALDVQRMGRPGFITLRTPWSS